jgi:hypothetical protein
MMGKAGAYHHKREKQARLTMVQQKACWSLISLDRLHLLAWWGVSP